MGIEFVVHSLDFSSVRIDKNSSRLFRTLITKKMILSMIELDFPDTTSRSGVTQSVRG